MHLTVYAPLMVLRRLWQVLYLPGPDPAKRVQEKTPAIDGMPDRLIFWSTEVQEGNVATTIIRKVKVKRVPVPVRAQAADPSSPRSP